MGTSTIYWIVALFSNLSPILAAEIPGSQTAICPTDLGCRCSGVSLSEWYVDCSALGLTSIPTGLPTYTTALLLSYNRIEVIAPTQLSELPSLKKLYLNYNNISLMLNGSFLHLTSLQELHLMGNNIDFTNQTGATSVVESPSLLLLDIRNNVAYTTYYPTDLWQYIPSLQELRMDGILGQFGDEFLYLHKLETLSFRGGQCDMYSISSDTFAGLRKSPLRRLDLEHCNITTFSGQAFRHLSSLLELSLASNPLGSNVMDMASGLHYTDIEHLDLNSTGLPMNLQELYSSYLCNIGIKWLTVANNGLATLGNPAIMPRCFQQLEVYSAAENMILDTGTSEEWFQLNNIRYLNLSNQLQYPSGRRTKRYVIYCQVDTVCQLRIPSTLEVVDVSNSGLHLPILPGGRIVGKVSMKVLLASNTGIKQFISPVYCDYEPTFEKLDVSENGIDYIHQEIFSHCNWTSLKIVLAGGNRLGGLIKAHANHIFWSTLYGLQIMDLSRNMISVLHRNIFVNNTELTHLLLSGNQLSEVLPEISHLKMLQQLDLSGNFIKCLSFEIMASLDILLSNSNLVINLQDNDLQCICPCLEFVEWAGRQKENLLDIASYSCTFDDFTEVGFRDMELVLSRLEGDCSTMWWLYASVMMHVIVLVITIVVSLAYRWRFSIKILCFRSKRIPESSPGRYEYDCFVVYTRQDEEWVEKELCRNLEGEAALSTHTENGDNPIRLCYHKRNFRLGALIYDNISEAFDKSRTTLVVVSNAALGADWWNLEFKLAVSMAAIRGYRSLFLVFLEPLESHLVTPDLRRVFHTFTCARWKPGHALKQRKFWHKLQLAIKTPEPNYGPRFAKIV